jgi:exonuclease VII small subunit
MFRLNQKAFKIVATEIERVASKDSIAGDVAKKEALKRLNRLRQKGTPVTEAELKELFQDILPGFSDRTIWQAIKVNHPPNKLWLIPKISLGITILAGIIWLINLPYPMIRRPIARTVPILLLPSYLTMDYNYRQAIAKVEQADQLVNNVTSLADLQLGAKKVAEAQQHLDKLPVWFIGYEPQVYNSLFRFSWLFTLDEFQTARANVGRMEATIFQETNAIKQLENGEIAINQAKQNYQQATDELSKKNAISTWQNGIDKLTQIPSTTLAFKMADTKLNAYRRDFEAISGFIAGNERTNILISAAQVFANKATIGCEKSPHSVEQWQECNRLWQEAISRLNEVPLEDPGYLKAQTLLAEYETNLGNNNIRQQIEFDSVKAFEVAQSQIINLPKQIDNSNREFAIHQIQAIMVQLEKVQVGTTVYQQATDLMASAEKKLQTINN